MQPRHESRIGVVCKATSVCTNSSTTFAAALTLRSETLDDTSQTGASSMVQSMECYWITFCCINGTLNSACYISGDSTRYSSPTKPYVKQDNARPHVAGIVRTFLNTENVRLLPWPASSPDLSPIENRRRYLLWLSRHLPSESPLCREWPSSPRCLHETSYYLRKLYHKWRCHKYRLRFDQTARNRMREKVTASMIFKDRKSSYPKSVSHPFRGDYVRLRHNVKWKKIAAETGDQYVVFADIINKIARASGKVRAYFSTSR
ncbi:unconventional myosin-Ib [Trichonephila clavipes]|uniref:Unconventional myosin-Ib n=1 Tax=Trichonephila clavipes TaxID=2585209 RepID=A0A8X6STE3_TRICX|nr:unconventional myosin-Ib [Trichonephila clavipes]